MSPYMIKRIVGLVTVVATALLICMVTIVVVQTVQLTRLNNQSRMLDANIEMLMATKTDLENGIAERNTAEYVEEQARENLGMIKDGELVYVFE